MIIGSIHVIVEFSTVPVSLHALSGTITLNKDVK